MDIDELARAYRRRADARETERLERFDTLRGEARRVARALRERFGPDSKVFLFGSALDRDRFRGESDIDLAMEGLEPGEYWEAWALAERVAGTTRVDLVRLESATSSLREHVRSHGRELS